MVDFHAKEVCYHHKCKLEFMNKARKTTACHSKPEGDKLTIEDLGDKLNIEDLYYKLFYTVEDTILNKCKPMTFISVYNTFRSFYSDTALDPHKVLHQKTAIERVKTYKMYCGSKKEGNILYHSRLDPQLVPLILKGNHDSKDSDRNILCKAASILRKIILEVRDTCNPIPSAPSSEDFKNGQAEAPEMCIIFFQDVLCTNPNDPSDREKRLALSLSSGLLYVATKGFVKTTKKLCMAVGIKSLTGSETVCNILHRLGHSISATLEKEYITEIGQEISRRQRAVPDGLNMEPGLATYIIWDNHDELPDSVVAGLQGTHDTMGIVCQNRRNQQAFCDAVPTRSLCISPPSAKRRRSFISIENFHIVPYKKIPKANRFQYRNYEAITLEALATAKLRDTLWLFHCVVHNMTPMWKGWNSIVSTDDLPVQYIGFPIIQTIQRKTAQKKNDFVVYDSVI